MDTTSSSYTSSIPDSDILGPAYEAARISALSAKANAVIAAAKAKADAQISADNSKKESVQSVAQSSINGAQGTGRLIGS